MIFRVFRFLNAVSYKSHRGQHLNKLRKRSICHSQAEKKTGGCRPPCFKSNIICSEIYSLIGVSAAKLLVDLVQDAEFLDAPKGSDKVVRLAIAR